MDAATNAYVRTTEKGEPKITRVALEARGKLRHQGVLEPPKTPVR